MRRTRGKAIVRGASIGVAFGVSGCGLLDPVNIAALRISLVCGVRQSDVVFALEFVRDSAEFSDEGTGNIASLLDELPELEVIAANPRCLDAFLDAVDRIK